MLKKIWLSLRLLIALPLLLIFGIYLFTVIPQMWPEPIHETFFSSCGSELGGEYKVLNRQHNYSNAPMGLWYSDHGTIEVSTNQASALLLGLQQSELYIYENNWYVKFIIGDIRATCRIDPVTGIVDYGLTLW